MFAIMWYEDKGLQIDVLQKQGVEKIEEICC